MGSQSLFSGFCSKAIIPSLQVPENPVFASSSPSSPSFIHTKKWFSANLRSLIASGSVGNKRLICSANVERRLEDLTFDQKNLRSETRRKRLAVFVSGGGSNFRSIHEACARDLVNGNIAVVVTNKRDCGGAEYAIKNNIPIILFPEIKDEPESLSPSDLVAALRKYKVDFILLAGYLKLIPTELVQAYPRSILNIHPSLLPAFGGKGYYGMKVHKAVIASGARYSGATIHFVDEHYDTGCILAQRVVPVLPHDTAEGLAARVLREEHQLYVDVTAALCEERIMWREDGVPLIYSKEDPNKYS